MHLSQLEPDSQLSSQLAQVDVRIKLICAAVLVIGTVAIPQQRPLGFALMAALLVVFSLVSRVPMRYIAVRLLIAAPLLVMIAISVPFLHGTGTPLFTVPRLGWTATAEGLQAAVSTVSKSLLCIWTVVLLAGTTDFARLLEGLSRLHVPALVVVLMALMYRYLFVISDEALRMVRARQSRGRPPTRRYALKVTASMIMALMARCVKRSENIARAMVARGFDGHLPVLQHECSANWKQLAGAAVLCLMVIGGVAASWLV